PLPRARNFFRSRSTHDPLEVISGPPEDPRTGLVVITEDFVELSVHLVGSVANRLQRLIYIVENLRGPGAIILVHIPGSQPDSTDDHGPTYRVRHQANAHANSTADGKKSSDGCFRLLPRRIDPVHWIIPSVEIEVY